MDEGMMGTHQGYGVPSPNTTEVREQSVIGALAQEHQDAIAQLEAITEQLYQRLASVLSPLEVPMDSLRDTEGKPVSAHAEFLVKSTVRVQSTTAALAALTQRLEV